MASDYGLNFGFRRSDESLRVSEGRVKTPKTGPVLLLGTAVEIDPGNPGYLRQAAAAAAPRTGVCGLLVQEEAWDRSIYGSERVTTSDLGAALKNRLSVITNGPGAKVWFKNSAAQTRADGRETLGVTLVTLTGLAVGDSLGWNGTTWAETALEAEAFMEVVHLDIAKNYLEATLLK